MSRTSIEWTESVWNPLRGCSRISPGCEHCYAERHASRFSGEGLPFHGYAKDGRWTRKVSLLGGDALTDPLGWRTPRRVFLSMSDLFHEGLEDDALDHVFAVMAICALREGRSSHTFQMLTKRADRMHRYLTAGIDDLRRRIAAVGARMMEESDGWHETLRWQMPWPLPNLWLGVSVEDQEYADMRIPKLLSSPAAVRIVSYEPALGPVDLTKYLRVGLYTVDGHGDDAYLYPRLGWVIAGGESGAGARPFDEAWGRAARDACAAAGVPFFFKQMGKMVGGVSRKGGDLADIPADLRVRQYPAEARP